MRQFGIACVKKGLPIVYVYFSRMRLWSYASYIFVCVCYCRIRLLAIVAYVIIDHDRIRFWNPTLNYEF